MIQILLAAVISIAPQSVDGHLVLDSVQCEIHDSHLKNCHLTEGHTWDDAMEEMWSFITGDESKDEPADPGASQDKKDVKPVIPVDPLPDLKGRYYDDQRFPLDSLDKV